jgi:lipoteichoic acid synthase
MSFTVDLKVGGEEVTPFLNSLARDSSIYYNGHMRPDITCGESSDGQFIYMTGMLPLRSEITITKTKRNVLPALPKVLKEARGLRSRMVIPTSAAMWSQDAMCKAYGVERLYSVNEYHGSHEPCLSDDQVVALADSVDGLSREPFFSMVLTFSTHMPYDKTVDPTFKATSQVQPEDYANYLNACHFMDRNLQRYVESLKRHGLYDNSLILIVSDHHVQEHFLTLPGVKQRELPVFIIHGGIDRQNAWTGPCHQLDVFTTLLDLLGIRPAWTGLGHNLINPHYENSLPEGSPKWDYSDWMIQSDWFKR